MGVTDPRERHDDLLEWHVEEEVDAEEFAAHREMEAYRSGWVAIGFVFDETRRLLLAYDESEEAWLAPGGTLEPSETLFEGLAREVREETGVDVGTAAPRAVADVVTRHRDRTTGFSVVFYEARAEATAVGDDLGVDDEAITDAEWFTELPASVYDREGAEAVLERCERWDW